MITKIYFVQTWNNQREFQKYILQHQLKYTYAFTQQQYMCAYITSGLSNQNQIYQQQIDPNNVNLRFAQHNLKCGKENFMLINHSKNQNITHNYYIGQQNRKFLYRYQIIYKTKPTQQIQCKGLTIKHTPFTQPKNIIYYAKLYIFFSFPFLVDWNSLVYNYNQFIEIVATYRSKHRPRVGIVSQKIDTEPKFLKDNIMEQQIKSAKYIEQQTQKQICFINLKNFKKLPCYFQLGLTELKGL
eukprot:TRINITY_DN2935_c2_g2_i3.p1 TRINITY_DN2935_c2_g2~~TRINITY_DN2935_c2_g2_i3.p1  ORF type:complete len:242 (-),score=-9.53 TRINITY_DN2935_c2_g2_i3:1954-2679(-)